MLKLLLVLSTLVFAISTWAQDDLYKNQAPMEQALEGVQRLEDLLENPERLERYYQAANNYYQNKLDREFFDVIVSQMKTLLKDNPGFGERLLRGQENLTPYTLISEIKTYGRILEWWNWERAAKKIFKDKQESPESLDSYRQQFQDLSMKISAFEESLKGLSKIQSGLRRAQFYQQMREANEDLFHAVINHVYYRDQEIQQLIEISDADLTLFIFDRLLNAKIAKLGLPENVVSLVQGVVPKTSDLLKEKWLFPVEMVRTQRGVDAPVEPLSETVYHFVPFKRRLHAVWKGIWLRECVGGGDKKPTPRRWATVALEQVNNYAVEKQNSFVGFIQELGIKRKDKIAIYYATEFGVPNLKEKMITINEHTGLPQKIPMIDQWLTVAPKNIVRVKSSSTVINNAKVLPALNASQAWNLRIPKGKASDFELVDQAFADQIIASSHRHDFEPTNDYGVGIISDATVPDSNNLKTLVGVAWTPKSLMKLFAGGKLDFSEFRRLAEAYPELIAQMPLPELAEQLFKKMSSERALDLAKILNYVGSHGVDIRSYSEDLLANPKVPPVAKLYLFEIAKNQERGLDYLKQIELTPEVVRSLFQGPPLGFAFAERVQLLLRQRIMTEKIKNTYGSLAEVAGATLGSDRLKIKFIDLLEQLDPADQTTLKNVLQGGAGLFAKTSHSERLRLLAIFKRANLQEEAIDTFVRGSELSMRDYATSPEYIEFIFDYAIRQHDVNLLRWLFEVDVRFDSFDAKKITLVNKLVTRIVQSENLELIAVLNNNEMIKSLFRSVGEPELQLSPEAQLFRKAIGLADPRGHYHTADIEAFLQEYSQRRGSEATRLPLSCQRSLRN